MTGKSIFLRIPVGDSEYITRRRIGPGRGLLFRQRISLSCNKIQRQAPEILRRAQFLRAGLGWTCDSAGQLRMGSRICEQAR